MRAYKISKILIYNQLPDGKKNVVRTYFKLKISYSSGIPIETSEQVASIRKV